MEIGIVTDSTCDLSREELNKHNIEVVPLTVNFSDSTYQDKVDITSEEFFNKLREVDELPTTSQPSTGMFLKKYREMAEKYDYILSIHISGKLSGTVESANLAAQQVEGVEVKVFDSQTTTLALGMMVLFAAGLVKRKDNVNDILNILNKARENSRIYFTVSDLTYLEKGGRIGKAQAFIGSILNFNPILELSGAQGEIIPFEKVRGNKKTSKRLIELLANLLKGEKNARVSFLYGEMDKNISNFKSGFNDFITGQQADKNIVKKEGVISPVLGCHVGMAVYGFAIIKGDFLNNV